MKTAVAKTDIFLPGPSSDVLMFHEKLAATLIASGQWFEYNGQLVQVSELNRTFSLIYHRPHSIIPAIEAFVRCLRWNPTAASGIPASMPASIAKTITESQAFTARFPHVAIWAESSLPYWEAPDLLAFTQPGYNSTCQVFQAASALEPMQMSSDQAREHWGAFLDDFPFASLADISNVLSFILSGYLRLLYDGPAPMFVVTANTPRAGKDALVELIHLSLIGRHRTIGLQAKDVENEKLFTSYVIEGDRLIHAANVVGKLRSPFFERISTQREYTSRILGKSQTVSTINHFLLSMSGNSDFTVAGDLTTRCIPISLFLDVSNPNSRTFTRPNLQRWAVANRLATLGMLRRFLLDWDLADRPAPSGAFSSFPSWFSVAAAVAQHALGSPLNIASTSSQADPRVDGLAHVLSVLNDPLHDDRDPIPKDDLPQLNRRAWSVGGLRKLTAALQKHDPELLDEFPLNAIEFNQAQGAACRFGRFVHARANVPTGPWIYRCINPDVSRAERRLYSLTPHTP